MTDEECVQKALDTKEPREHLVDAVARLLYSPKEWQQEDGGLTWGGVNVAWLDAYDRAETICEKHETGERA